MIHRSIDRSHDIQASGGKRPAPIGYSFMLRFVILCLLFTRSVRGLENKYLLVPDTSIRVHCLLSAARSHSILATYRPPYYCQTLHPANPTSSRDHDHPYFLSLEEYTTKPPPHPSIERDQPHRAARTKRALPAGGDGKRPLLEWRTLLAGFALISYR